MKTLKQPKNGNQSAKGRQVWQETAIQTQSQGEGRPSQEAVALEAYFTYVQQGRPEGCDVQHWLEAEARMLST